MLTFDPENAKIRVLIPEGSSLSAREAVAVLGRLGYTLAVCDPNPLCVCRFSRFVKNFYRSPRLSADPAAYLNFILDLLRREHFDVLLPVHENALLFAKAADRIAPYTHSALADFAHFERVQSKAAFSRLLDELGLPQPPTRLATSLAELEACREYPFYIKTAYGTAGFGTWRVENPADQRVALAALKDWAAVGPADPVLVQGIAPGKLEVVQTVFDHGRLVAAHIYRQTAVGVGGSAAARMGTQRPLVVEHMRQLGEALAWHGSLMVDYLVDEATGQVAYIDPNPRMGETMNAAYHGMAFADLIVRLSLGKPMPALPENWTPVESHILITMLLGAAYRKGTRRAVLGELISAIFKRGPYRTSREDFADLITDFPSLVPVFMVAAQLLIRPESCRQIAAGAVQNYALTQSAVQKIRVLLPLC